MDRLYGVVRSCRFVKNEWDIVWVFLYLHFNPYIVFWLLYGLPSGRPYSFLDIAGV